MICLCPGLTKKNPLSSLERDDECATAPFISCLPFIAASWTQQVWSEFWIRVLRPGLPACPVGVGCGAGVVIVRAQA